MSDGFFIALVLRDDRVEWTAVQRRKSRVDITQQKVVELQWPEGMEDRRSSEAAAFLKGKLPPVKGSVGIAVPSDRVLMRVVELPSIDLEELRGMAELQVDKFSPFPTDQMAIAIEVLHQAEDRSRVLIAAVQNEYIDHLGDFLMKAGLYPQSVDVDVLGWWTLIRDAGHLTTAGQEMVLIHDDHCAQLIVTRDGIPVMIRALDTRLPLHDPAFAAEAVEEIEYTVMTLEAGWGAMPTMRLAIWTRGAVPAEVVEPIARHAHLAVQAFDLATLPPLSEGLSRRMISPESASLDLAPATWRRGILSKQLQRRALLAGSSALAVWLVVIGGVWFWTQHQRSLLEKNRADINRLQSEVEAVRELRRQVEWLQQYADRSYSTLECLREVSELLPAGVDITSFTYNKASQVNLRGEADTDDPVNEFIGRLEKSGLFTSVTTEGISTASRGGRTRSQFRITMTLPAPPAEEGS